MVKFPEFFNYSVQLLFYHFAKFQSLKMFVSHQAYGDPMGTIGKFSELSGYTKANSYK